MSEGEREDGLRDVRVLLQAIADLIDNEDAAEPLDYAIAHANKALAILAARPASNEVRVTHAMINVALNAWFASPPSETDQGLERSMKAALTAALAAEPGESKLGSKKVTLRNSEKGLLGWLQKGDGQYGECQGETLNRLIDLGLAVVQGVESGLANGFIAKGTDIMYRAVSITDAGRAALAEPGESKGDAA